MIADASIARNDSRAASSKAMKAEVKKCDNPHKTIKIPIARNIISYFATQKPLFEQRLQLKAG